MTNTRVLLAKAEVVDAISIRKLCASFPKLKPGTGLHLCDIYGFVTGVKATHDDRGVKIKFFGEFFGYEIVGDGNEDLARSMRSKSLTLPPVVSDILVSAQVGDGRCAEFGFRIGIMGNDTTLGFHYTVERFIGLEAFSPLDRLVQRVSEDE